MKWVSWCTVRGLPSPETSILFENWLFAIGRGIIMGCSNTCYPKGVSYNQLSEEAKTRVDRQTKTVHGLPFEPFLSDYNRQDFHPYHQMRDDITRWCQQHLTPSGDGWACSRSMVCIDCSMSPSLRTPSWSWKGRGAQTWPISPLPPSMLWLTMIMVAIGAWIIPIRHVGLESGTIIAPTYGPVK